MNYHEISFVQEWMINKLTVKTIELNFYELASNSDKTFLSTVF